MKSVFIFILTIPLFLDASPPLFWKELECTPYWKKKPKSILDILTSSRFEADVKKAVKFYLFTRKNPECFQELQLSDTVRLQMSNFSPFWPTRIIIHGWMNDLYSRINRLIKTAYLKKGNFNVVIVDWKNLASDISYHRASKYIDKIGQIVATFTKFLHDTINVSYNDIYLIGHSLGAQIAGSAGFQSEGIFNTIFALDPAELNFEVALNRSRIKASSAKYVESIHTDMGLFGANFSVGHSSFFPNYGKNQPGCNLFRSCSHTRAYLYFSESINSDIGFWATPCKNMTEIYGRKCTPCGKRILMGGEPAIKKSGYFYLTTNREAFFARGYWF